MQKQKVQLPNITLVGLTARTNNKNEINPAISKIAGLFSSYWQNRVAESIKHRKTPGQTYAVYTEYDSDEHGDYTYFIGEAVNSIEDQDLAQFKTLTIPASNYQKFTTEPGKMPDVVISAWQEIWKITDFGSKRRYIADFEVYDQRACDPNNAALDIYIGVET